MDAFEINHETAYLAVLFVFSMESLRFSAVVLKDDKPCNTIQEKSMTCNKYCSDVIGKCNKYCSDVIGKCNKDYTAMLSVSVTSTAAMLSVGVTSTAAMLLVKVSRMQRCYW